ncbi:hypothetical protein Prudu_009025, partial [Prunus dulcis]
ISNLGTKVELPSQRICGHRIIKRDNSGLSHYISLMMHGIYKVFIYVPCPHTAEVLADSLLEYMFGWNLDRKLSTLTMDNCSTNDSMIVIVLDKICYTSLILDGCLFHMRCCAHILNLVVRDGLDVIKKSIEKITYSVAYWLGTQKREEKLAKQLICEPLYKEMSNESDWAKTKELVDKLTMFYDATLLFSETNYLTTNLCFKNNCVIIYEWIVSEQEEVRAMTLQMQTKFEKYWDTIHGLMGVASILDPTMQPKRLRNIKIFFMTWSRSINQNLYKQLDVFVSHSTITTYVKSELDHYLEQSLLPRNNDDDFDILCWWKSNAIKYPTLHDIARDILAILVSMVSSESCFSTSGRIISPHTTTDFIQKQWRH